MAKARKQPENAQNPPPEGAATPPPADDTQQELAGVPEPAPEPELVAPTKAPPPVDEIEITNVHPVAHLFTSVKKLGPGESVYLPAAEAKRWIETRKAMRADEAGPTLAQVQRARAERQG